MSILWHSSLSEMWEMFYIYMFILLSVKHTNKVVVK